MIQDMNPELSRLAAQQQLSMHVIPMNATEWILKNTVQKVQETTSDYTNINTAQQYCWHHLGDQIYNMTHEKNTGLCKIWQDSQ